jgi:hypothetical protein
MIDRLVVEFCDKMHKTGRIVTLMVPIQIFAHGDRNYILFFWSTNEQDSVSLFGATF